MLYIQCLVYSWSILYTVYIAGDSQGFNDTYLEALRQQREAQRSVGSDAAELFQQPLPYEIYLKIFSYLSPKHLCQAMRVCKVRQLVLHHNVCDFGSVC